WDRFDLSIKAEATTVSVGISHAAGWPAADVPALKSHPVAVWGAQLEEQPFPTSYIPTSEKSATRSADVLTIPRQSVPMWMRQGVWQLDVLPEFGSNEPIPGRRYTLLSFGAATDVALVPAVREGK